MLAQAQQFTSADSTRVIVWSFVLIVLLVLGFAAVAKVKRRLRDEIDKDPAATGGFTLSDLREMHRNGVISDEELEKAKAKIVQAARKTSQRDASTPPGPGL